MEEVKEINRHGMLIAEFMEIKEVQFFLDDANGNKVPLWYAGYLGYRTHFFTVPGKAVAHLVATNRFNNSWDWLMPVVEKICRTKIGGGEVYVEYAYIRTFGMINEETGDFMVRFNWYGIHESKDLFQATYDAVIEVLQWMKEHEVF